MMHPLVLVEWEDACGLDETVWVEREPETEFPEYKPLIVQTVGFLLHESEAGVIVTGSMSPTCFGPRDQIPRGMIRRIVHLKPQHGRKTE